MAVDARGKPSLSKEVLNQHGISYEDRIAGEVLDNSAETNLPPHVVALKTALIYFGCPLHKILEPMFEEQHETFAKTQSEGRWNSIPPASLYFESMHDTKHQTAKKEASREHFERLEIATQNVIRMKGAKDKENTWTRFPHSAIFRPFIEAVESSTAIEELFDNWCLEQDVTWRELTTMNDPSAPRIKSPKPDLTYAFPMFTDTKALPLGFADHSCARNFSAQFLQELRKGGGVHEVIVSSVTTGLLKKSIAELTAWDVMCFPWAVVEVKHAEAAPSDVTYCYCQAANGSAAALTLQEALFKEAYGSIPEDLPPIIAFTCVGAEFKVWLTYLGHENQQNYRKMVCIWATSLEICWGIQSARLIVENMHTWASRILRPRLSECLSFIRAKRTPSQLGSQHNHPGSGNLTTGATSSITLSTATTLSARKTRSSKLTVRTRHNGNTLKPYVSHTEIHIGSPRFDFGTIPSDMTHRIRSQVGFTGLSKETHLKPGSKAPVSRRLLGTASVLDQGLDGSIVEITPQERHGGNEIASGPNRLAYSDFDKSTLYTGNGERDVQELCETASGDDMTTMSLPNARSKSLQPPRSRSLGTTERSIGDNNTGGNDATSSLALDVSRARKEPRSSSSGPPISTAIQRRPSSHISSAAYSDRYIPKEGGYHVSRLQGAPVLFDENDSMITFDSESEDRTFRCNSPAYDGSSEGSSHSDDELEPDAVPDVSEDEHLPKVRRAEIGAEPDISSKQLVKRTTAVSDINERSFRGSHQFLGNKDILDMQERAIVALAYFDDDFLTSQDAFRTFLERTTTTQLKDAIAAILFVRAAGKPELKYGFVRKHWLKKERDRLNSVCGTLTDGLRRSHPRYSADIEMTARSYEPALIKKSLLGLWEDERLDEMRSIFTTLVSCLTGEECADVFHAQKLNFTDDESATLGKRALDKLYRMKVGGRSS